MISTTWTDAPAGFLGLGSADVRPCAGRPSSPAAPSPWRPSPLRPGDRSAHRRHRRPSMRAGVATVRPQAARRPAPPHQQLTSTPRTTAPPSGSTPRGDRRANRSTGPPRGRGTRTRDPRPFSLSAAPGPDHRSAGPRRPSQTTSTRRSGSAADDRPPDVPPPTRAPLDRRASRRGGRTPRWPRPRCGAPCRAGSRTRSCGSPRARPQLEQAKALCGDCPVRDACLAGALDRAEPWGVWGGEIFERGVVIARKRPRGRPRKVVAA